VRALLGEGFAKRPQIQPVFLLESPFADLVLLAMVVRTG
jgi:hypothetical protein